MVTGFFQTQVVTVWKETRATASFYFSTELTDLAHTWEIASDITQTLMSFEEWLFRYSALIGNDAGIRSITTRIVAPMGGAAYRRAFMGGGIQGTGGSAVGISNEAVRIRWIADTEQHGKHQVRIGPLPVGATRSVDYFGFFYAACVAFGSVHIGTHLSPLGREFTACVRNADGSFHPIVRGDVYWPPSWASKRSRGH